MMPAAAVVGGYGFFTIIGGIIGYVKARSLVSVTAGSVCGLLLLICAAGIQQGNRIAAAGSLVVALVLGLRFVKTWRKHHRVMPDLLMVVFSMAAGLAAGVALLR